MGHPLFGPTINPQYDTDRVFIRGSGGASPPAAPTLDSVTPGDTTNTVVWTPPAGSPDSYNLYWSLTSPVSKASNKLTGVTSPYVHTGRTNGTPYYYAVTAVKGGLESALSNEGSGTPVEYILDAIGGSFMFALSSRRLSLAYTANKALRCREGNGGTESDIGFSGGDLAAADLTTFCGAGNGFEVTRYDQSGNGRNFGMSDANYQAKLVEAGVIVAGPAIGRYAARFDRTFDAFYGRICRYSTSVTPTSAWWFWLVGISDETAADVSRSFFEIYAATPVQFSPRLIHFNGTIYKLVMSGNDGANVVNNSLDMGNWFVAVGVIADDGGTCRLRINGNEATAVGGTPVAAGIDIGAFLNGRVSEFVAKTGSPSAGDITTAETNLKSYYGISW